MKTSDPEVTNGLVGAHEGCESMPVGGSQPIKILIVRITNARFTHLPHYKFARPKVTCN